MRNGLSWVSVVVSEVDEDGVPLSEDVVDDAALSSNSSAFEPDEDGDEDSAYSATPEGEQWSTEVAEGHIKPHSRASTPRKPLQTRSRKGSKARRVSEDDEGEVEEGEEEEAEDNSDGEWSDQSDLDGDRGLRTKAKRRRTATASRKRGSRAKQAGKGGKAVKAVRAQRGVVADRPRAMLDNALGFSGVSERDKMELLSRAKQSEALFTSTTQPPPRPHTHRSPPLAVPANLCGVALPPHCWVSLWYGVMWVCAQVVSGRRVALLSPARR